MHAPTVRDALQIISANLKTSNTGAERVLDARGKSASSFAYVVTAADIESADQIVDAAVARIVNTMRQLCGPAWRPALVRLTRDPPRDRAPFLRFFGAPVDFAQQTARVVFDAGTLDAQVRDRNPDDDATILAPLLEEAAADARGDFLSAVRSIIRSRIGAGALTRESVCRALGLNARTLTHRLEAFGVTYSSLADEAKFEAAQGLLIKKKRIADIATHLGFTPQSAFTRAFKAWSGTTPARWRAAREAAYQRPPIERAADYCYSRAAKAETGAGFGGSSARRWR